MNYGPTEPLSDPKLARKLHDLLASEGLVPMSVDIWIHDGSEVTTVSTSPPQGVDFLAIRGVTSRNTSADNLTIIRADVHDVEFLRDTDASAFNLSHMVPLDGPCVSFRHPLSLKLRLEATETTRCRLIFWGIPLYSGQLTYPTMPPFRHGFAPKPAPADLDPPPGPSKDLLHVLRYLHEHELEVDERIRSLLELYEPILKD